MYVFCDLCVKCRRRRHRVTWPGMVYTFIQLVALLTRAFSFSTFRFDHNWDKMAAASSRSLPNLASVELDEITWTNEVIKAQQWSCYSPSACQWLQPSPTTMVQSGQLYHIDDNDYCCPYSSDHIPPTATVSCVTY